MDFDLIRRYRWTLQQIDLLPAGFAEQLTEAHAGWDEAAEVIRKRDARRGTPPPQDEGRPLYGARGVRVRGR